MGTIANLGVRLTADARQARQEFSSFKSTVDSLKKTIGTRSLLKDTLEIVRGGGTVAGAVLAARTIQDVAEKANDMADQVRRGQMSIRDMIGETARAIPVLGDFARAFDEIGSGGERRELERVNTLVDLMKGATEAARSAREELKKSGMSDFDVRLKEIRDETNKTVAALMKQEQAAADLARTIQQNRSQHKAPMTRQLEEMGLVESREIPIPEFTAARDIQSAIRDRKALGFNRTMKLIVDDIRAAEKESQEFLSSIDRDFQEMLTDDLRAIKSALEESDEFLAGIRRDLKDLFFEDIRAIRGELEDSADFFDTITEAVRDANEFLEQSGRQRLNELAARGQAMRDSLRTPMQEFADQIKEIDDLVTSGELNWQQYEEAVKRATEVRDAALRADAERRIGSDPGDAPTAMAGSRAALEIIHRVNREDRREERIKALIDEAKRQTRVLERIAAAQENVEVIGNLN